MELEADLAACAEEEEEEDLAWDAGKAEKGAEPEEECEEEVLPMYDPELRGELRPTVAGLALWRGEFDPEPERGRNAVEEEEDKEEEEEDW